MGVLSLLVCSRSVGMRERFFLYSAFSLGYVFRERALTLRKEGFYPPCLSSSMLAVGRAAFLCFGIHVPLTR